MNAAEIKSLRAAGYGIGDAGDFLGLADWERKLVDVHLAVERATEKVTGEYKHKKSLKAKFKLLFESGGDFGDVVREMEVLKASNEEFRKKYG